VRAAREWSSLIAASEELELLGVPELDILAFRPAAETASAVDRASQALFDAAAAEGIHLSVLRVTSDRLPGVEPDVPDARILRSVLMKPEHEPRVAELHSRVCALARGAMAAR
jgi:hypothetical protein